MFKDRKLLVTGGAGSIGSSICNYFKDNGCEEIFSTTTNLNKVKPDQKFYLRNKSDKSRPDRESVGVQP